MDEKTENTLQPHQIFPVLEASDWEGAGNLHAAPIFQAEEGKRFPWVVFCKQIDGERVPISQEETDLTGTQIVRYALHNLATTPANWQETEFAGESALEIADDAGAAVRILDMHFLADAHQKLAAERLCISIPHAGLMRAIADAPEKPDVLAQFLAEAQQAYEETGSNRISDKVFFVENNMIIGYLEDTGDDEDYGEGGYMQPMLIENAEGFGEYQVFLGANGIGQLTELCEEALNRINRTHYGDKDFSGKIDFILVPTLVAKSDRLMDALALIRSQIMQMPYMETFSQSIGKPVEIQFIHGDDLDS